MLDKITDYLTTYATSIKYEDFPPETVHKAKGLLIDTLGCAIGGYSSEAAKIARKIAMMVRPCELPATIIGSGQQTSLELGTFANGIMMRYLDFSDTFISKDAGHPSDNFAPVLTSATALHASGKDLLVASILAYEVFCRLADQANLPSRGFDQPVWGNISTVLGTSRIFGLSQSQMVQAVNLAIAPNTALRQTRYGEVSMWKGCAMANASRNAVFAVLLAREGMTGPGPIFEGRAGLITAVTGPFQLEKFGGNGRPFRIMDVTIKRYPCGGLGQTAVDAAIKLHAKISNVKEIAQIKVDTFSRAMDTMAGDAEKWRPTTRETADHSLPYVVAVALMYGTIEAKYFDEEYLGDPDLLELMQKIKIAESDECNKLSPGAQPSRLEVTTKSGEKFVEMVVHHHGHYLNPLTDEEIEQKFDSVARELLTSKQRKELFSTIWNLEKLNDVSELMPLLKI